MNWFYSKERGEGETTAIFSLVVIILIVIGMGYGIVRGIQRDNTETVLTARILSADIKSIGSGDDAKDHYLFSVQPVNKVDDVYESVGESETIEVADSRMHSQWNSADIYFTLKNNVGAVYTFKLQGWRDGYHSEFRNIYELKLEQDKGR